MDIKSDLDVIVVGAGPSGIACAITIAKKGNKVLVIEKASDFGVKNMFGGAVYLESLKELFPDDCQNLPYERFLKSHNYVILNDENSVCVSYNSKNSDSATITRYSFDTYLAQKAMDFGVYFVQNTTVEDLILKEGNVVGVKTENEEIYSKIVVLAEGFNSILSEKIGLKKKTEPKDAILGVKETIRLSYELINERFQLQDNEGKMFQFFGGLAKENENIPFALGFMYTFKNAVTIGVGVSMKSLQDCKVKPYEYLERLKEKPFVKNLLEGGEVIEYSAHSIPEGGYNELPKLYSNGVLIAGDAANLVDSVHFEGTNLGIKSGIIAGEVCNMAISKKDYSKKTLKEYKKALYKTFVIKDLKTYKDVIQTLFKRKSSIFSFYPKQIDEFFRLWTSASNKGKKQGYKTFLKEFFFKRSLIELIKDVISFVKCLIGATV